MRTSIAVARNHAAEVEEEFQRSQAPAECSVLWSHKSTRVIPEPAAVRSKAVRGGGNMRSRTPQLLTMCAALVVRPFCPGWDAGPGPELSRAVVAEKLQLGARRTVDLENQSLIIDRDCGLRQRECTSLSIVHLKFAPCNPPWHLIHAAANECHRLYSSLPTLKTLKVDSCCARD